MTAEHRHALANSGRTILRMSGIAKRFGGVNALSAGSLEIREGEVHALLGENGAGKSTLVKVISGVHQRDEGVFEWFGQPLDRHDLASATRLGIRVVYQQLNAIEHLTVCENLALGQERTSFGLLSRATERSDAKRALDRLGVSLDLDRPAGLLRLAERQLIEIARALRGNDVRLLVMDEPTSALGDKEVDRLFGVIRSLQREGLAIIYISHKLDEVFEISDRITVLRDGRTIGTVATAETSNRELISMMVGDADLTAREWTSNATARVVLSVDDLTTKTGLGGITFDLHEGEVLGVYGLLGSGRTELARALFGADAIEGGNVQVNGKHVRFRSPREARAEGLGFVPEERAQSTYPFLSVRDNLTTASIEQYAHGPWLDPTSERRAAASMVQDLRVRTPGIDEVMLRLSGGNQQKVVLGRWLLRSPGVLILDDPTSGIDVGAKEELYRLIAELTRQGKAILISSSELPELLAICDRVMVLHGGRLAGVLTRDELSQRALIELAVNGSQLA